MQKEKEGPLLKSQAEEIIEKKRKKHRIFSEGEEFVALKKVYYPYWVFEYGYNIETGIIKKGKAIQIVTVAIDAITGVFVNKQVDHITKYGKARAIFDEQETVSIDPRFQENDVKNFIPNKVDAIKNLYLHGDGQALMDQPQNDDFQMNEKTDKDDMYHEKMTELKKEINFPLKLPFSLYAGVFNTSCLYVPYWVGCLKDEKKQIQRFMTIDLNTGKFNKQLNNIITEDTELQRVVSP